MRVISVKFGHVGEQYSYLTSDLTVKVGDDVVVLTPSGLKIVQVYQVDVETKKATKPIVCKIDLDNYNRVVEDIARKAEIGRKIDKRVKELTETAMVRLLAKNDSELAALLAEREALNKE